MGLIITVLVVFILTTVNLAYESLQNGKLTEEISKETEIEETLEVDKDTNFETFLNINYANLELWQIEIPKINLYYPVFSYLDEELLKVSPCKFYGDSPKVFGNICIAGHNYDNSMFFSNLSLLNIDDEIYLYDTDNKKYIYKIFKTYEVVPSDLSPVFEFEYNSKELTLITCNNLNSNRLIVKSKQI